MKQQLVGWQMWTYLNWMCHVYCVGGVWVWKVTNVVSGIVLNIGNATSEADAKQCAEQACDTMLKNA